MIKSLSVQNFQSHRDTELVFSPGVNIIQGRSTSGKTALVRAILLLGMNRPSGFRYHSHFSDGPTKIELVVHESKIVFEKEKNKSTYTVDGEQYTGFGMGVPDIVEQILNLSDLNISEQLDPHFLVTCSPGQIAKELNKITHIDEVDEWLSILTTKLNYKNKEISILSEQCVVIEGDLEKYIEVDQINSEMAEIERLSIALVQAAKKIELLDSLCVEFESVVLSIEESFVEYKECELHIVAFSKLLGIAKESERYNAFIGVAEGMEGLFVEYSTCMRYNNIIMDMLTIDDTLCRFVPLVGVEEVLGGIDELKCSFVDVEREISLLGGILQNIFLVCENSIVADSEYIQEKKNYTDMLTALGVCPVCYSIFDSVVVNRIMKGC